MTKHSSNSKIDLLLQVEDLFVSYGKRQILRGVSLTVNRGEIIALVGGNGSGKSTLLKTIAGILKPTHGGIEFQNKDISKLSVNSRQKIGIGYLLQGGRIFPNLSVEENIEIALKHHRNVHIGIKAELGSFFPSLREKKYERAGLLSGGQRQMLAIEMVLAQTPELILLDEPTGSLSPSTASLILNSIASYIRDFRCGTIIVEQNVVEAKKIADFQIRLQDGDIIKES